ncbi:MAG: nucleotidyl transferase AbiEii/AbiGii toxin family protein [Candidatus Marinimicrobia bacterium]|nr:nucleotidyl transferase AbiEii/AbiGii toxin family protein [Candidatus Neomarinimicrobiota bacterium]
MKEYLRQLTEGGANAMARDGLVREYLQARVLESLQDAGAFMRWAFVGGTALRFLYSIPRFSEDLDFSLLREGQDPAFKPTLEAVKQALVREGYPIEVTVNERRPVFSSWLRFSGLPYEIGLSPHPSQVLSIKLELDTRPPAGAGVDTSIVRRHVTLNLCHYDQASLLAGKLHAVLCRQWTKGRDLYDLAWYLADRHWPAPNLGLLNAALAQTGWSGSVMTADNWRAELGRRLETLDWERARADVRPFLERARDIDLVSYDTLKQLLASRQA